MGVWECFGGLWVPMGVYGCNGCLSAFIGISIRYFMGA